MIRALFLWLRDWWHRRRRRPNIRVADRLCTAPGCPECREKREAAR